MVGSGDVAFAADDQAPVIDTARLTAAHVGDAYEFQLAGHDPQEQAITWSSTNLPPGLTVSASGLITGVPTAKDLFRIDVVATDPDGNSATKQLNWVIKGAPITLGNRVPEPQSWNLDREASLEVKIHDGVDISDDLPDVMTVGVTGVPEGLTSTITRDSGSGIFTVTVAGTPTTVGSGTLVYTAVDPDGDRLTLPVSWTVGSARPPAKPIGVRVDGANGTATVRWNGTYPDETASPVTGFVVRVDPGTSQTLPESARSVTLTGLDPTRTYLIGVRATSANGGDSPEETVLVSPTGLPFSPLSLIAGYANPVTFTGQIMKYGVTPTPDAEAFLEQKPAGSTTWSRVVAVRTNSSGVWTHTVNPTVNTQYRVVFAGGDEMWAATSAISTITVRYAVTATPSTTSTTVNTPVTFKGTIRPATPGVVAYLQRLTNGEWVTIQSTTETAGGAYSISRGFPRGTWSLRMYASGGGTNGYGFTSAIRLTVN